MTDTKEQAIAEGRVVRCDNLDCGLEIWMDRTYAAIATSIEGRCGYCGNGTIRVVRAA
jgi:hypothetical protein